MFGNSDDVLPMTIERVGLLLLYPGSDGNMACIEIDSKPLSLSASLFSALYHFIHLFIEEPSKQRTHPNATFVTWRNAQNSDARVPVKQ